MRIGVEILQGPDRGRTTMFHRSEVRIGRSRQNDVVLSDARVSGSHLVVRQEGLALVLCDMRSFHGSHVECEGGTLVLRDRSTEQSARVGRHARVSAGDTVLRIWLDAALPEQLPAGSARWADSERPRPAQADAARVSAPEHRGRSRFTEDGQVVHAVATTSSGEVEDAVSRHLGTQDPRLPGLFRLSRRLHAMRQPAEIWELVSRVAFEAFPMANFFAISVPDERPGAAAGSLRGVKVETRGRARVEGAGARLSQSLLREVFESHQGMLFLREKMQGSPSESILSADISACMVAPLMAHERCLGVIELDTRGTSAVFDPSDLEIFQVIASSTAFALERAELLESIYDMFEGIVRLSVTAIDARDPATAGHSERVAECTIRLALAVNDAREGPFADVHFTPEQLVELRYAALLHDFGKVGVREDVLMKSGRMPPEVFAAFRGRVETWRWVRRHAALRQALDETSGGVGSPAAVQARADALVAGELARMDDALRCIEAFQSGRPLTPEACAWIDWLAGISWTDDAGRTHAVLPPEDASYLRIPRGTLTPSEWDEMRSHALKSERYLSTIPWSRALQAIPAIAGAHHEKLDGSGYPHGRRGDEIPLPTRILTVADIFDAMTAIDRSYRAATPVEEAVAALLREASQGQLDAAVVSLLVERVLPELLAERGDNAPQVPGISR
jgi:3',5'-cyclic-nucleotide phosphodiesterase